jgi:TonB family protein
MSERFKSWAAISLLVVSVSGTTCAQTATTQSPTEGSGKKCLSPKVTYSPAPSPSYYPRKDSALTILYVLIDEKGHLLDPKVARSSGSDEFDHDAISTALKWRFKPATCDGTPISTHINLEIGSNVTNARK